MKTYKFLANNVFLALICFLFLRTACEYLATIIP